MPDEPINEPVKIKFTYIKSDDYQLSYINGIQGGFNAQGELLCNFFFESMSLPTEGEGIVNLSKNTLEEAPIRANFIREFKCGIIINPQQAYTIREWLDGKLKELDQKFKLSEEKECQK